MNSRVRGNLAVRIWVLLILATAFVTPARADQASAYGPELEGCEYPFTTERFSFPSQGQRGETTRAIGSGRSSVFFGFGQSTPHTLGVEVTGIMEGGCPLRSDAMRRNHHQRDGLPR